MQISSTNISNYSISNANQSQNDTSNSSSAFDAAYSEQTTTKTKREQEQENIKAEIKNFFDGIKKYGSTLEYVIKSNLDKIKKLLDEKREELKDKFGLNAKPPLTGEALENAQKQLEDAMEEYKKQLMKDLKANQLSDEQSKQYQTGKHDNSVIQKILQEL